MSIIEKIQDVKRKYDVNPHRDVADRATHLILDKGTYNSLLAEVYSDSTFQYWDDGSRMQFLNMTISIVVQRETSEYIKVM